MCMRTMCKSCGKPTWAGCGAHIEQALAGVPPEQRCQCHQAASPPRPGAGSSR